MPRDAAARARDQGATYAGQSMLRRNALIALLCVIGLHVTIYFLLRGSTGWKMLQAAPSARAPVTLRLVPRREPVAKPEPTASLAAPRPAAVRRDASAAITNPARSVIAPSASLLSTPQGDAAQPQAAAASQPPHPLDLTLPSGFATRPTARSPALDDPRANSARLSTPEARMAADLGTNLVEEDLGDGRRRLRRGASCLIVTQSRIGQLMPFNEAAARSPPLVSACP